MYIFPYPPPFQVHYLGIRCAKSQHTLPSHIHPNCGTDRERDRQDDGNERVHGIRFREKIPQNNNGTGSSERERVVMRVGSRGMEVMVRVVTELKNGETFCAVGQSGL